MDNYSLQVAEGNSFTFGKWANVPWQYVDTGYLGWAHNKGVLSLDSAALLKEYWLYRANVDLEEFSRKVDELLMATDKNVSTADIAFLKLIKEQKSARFVNIQRTILKIYAKYFYM